MPLSTLLIALSVALYALGFPPFGLGAVVWVALVPLLWACTRVSPRAGFALGTAWGVLLACAVGWCLPEMVSRFFAMPAAIGWLVFAAVGLGTSGIFYGAFGAWVAWLSRRRAAGPLAIAAGWVACELARVRLAGNPWALSGYAEMPLPLLQIADLGGVYAIGFAVMAVNATVAGLWAPELAGRRPRATRVAVAAAVLLALAYGEARLHPAAEPAASADDVRVAVVQAGTQRPFAWAPEVRTAGLERQLAMTASIVDMAAPQLVVWPENAVSFYLREPSREQASILGASLRGADLVIGGPDYLRSGGDVSYRNSVFLVRDGALAGRYDKRRLLPLAERPLFGWLAPGGTEYSAGGPPQILDAAHARVGALVCFETMYPDLARDLTRAGATVLVNLSNDDWFGHEAPARHHLRMAVLRAIETRRAVLRAAPTGVSAIVSPDGVAVAEGGYGAVATLTAGVRGATVETPYVRFGDAFAFATVALAIAASIAALPYRRRAGADLDAAHDRAPLAPPTLGWPCEAASLHRASAARDPLPRC